MCSFHAYIILPYSNLLCLFLVSIYRQDGSFNVDSVRVSKILGSGMHASEVVRGMVFQREAEGDIRKVENAKIAVFSCALDSATTDTKVIENSNFHCPFNYLYEFNTVQLVNFHST